MVGFSSSAASGVVFAGRFFYLQDDVTTSSTSCCHNQQPRNITSFHILVLDPQQKHSSSPSSSGYHVVVSNLQQAADALEKHYDDTFVGMASKTTKTTNTLYTTSTSTMVECPNGFRRYVDVAVSSSSSSSSQLKQQPHSTLYLNHKHSCTKWQPLQKEEEEEDVHVVVDGGYHIPFTDFSKYNNSQRCHNYTIYVVDLPSTLNLGTIEGNGPMDCSHDTTPDIYWNNDDGHVDSKTSQYYGGAATKRYTAQFIVMVSYP